MVEAGGPPSGHVSPLPRLWEGGEIDYATLQQPLWEGEVYVVRSA